MAINRFLKSTLKHREFRETPRKIESPKSTRKIALKSTIIIQKIGIKYWGQLEIDFHVKFSLKNWKSFCYFHADLASFCILKFDCYFAILACELHPSFWLTIDEHKKMWIFRKFQFAMFFWIFEFSFVIFLGIFLIFSSFRRILNIYCKVLWIDY